MSTWRMVREASTWGLSVLTVPAKVRPWSVAERAAGVALDARVVRLHHAAISAAAGARDLEAWMRVAARGGGKGPGSASKIRDGGFESGHPRLEVVRHALGRRGAELREHFAPELLDAGVVHGQRPGGLTHPSPRHR